MGCTPKVGHFWRYTSKIPSFVFQSTQLEHTCVQLVVLTFLCNELVMVTSFDDFAVFKNHDCVTVSYRTQAVSN